MSDRRALMGAVSGSAEGLSIDWADVTEVTIEANSINKTSGVATYFQGYSYHFVILASPITTNRQFVFGMSRNANGTMESPCRYETPSTIRPVAVDTSYDCYLVEGSKYYLLKKKA